MTDTFKLDARLAADTIAVADLNRTTMCLMNDAACPWPILVPCRSGMRGFHDLAADDLPRVTAETVHAAPVPEEIFARHKTNVAVPGNSVPQLHIHVHGRRCLAAAGPGVADPVPHDEAALFERRVELRAGLGA